MFVVRLVFSAARERLEPAGFVSSVSVNEYHRDYWRYTGIDCAAAQYILHHVGGRMRHIIREENGLMATAGAASVKHLLPS